MNNIKLLSVLTGLALITTSALASLPPVFEQVTQLYTATIPNSQLDWSTQNPRNVVIPKFNPQLGTLKSVQFQFTFEETYSTSIENLDNSPRNVNLTLNTKLNISSANLITITNNLLFPLPLIQLQSFDGTSDFQGNSSFNTSNVELPINITDLHLTENINTFIGTDNITILLTTKSLIYGNFPDNVNVRFLTTATASVSVQYSYLPTYTECTSEGTYTQGYWKNHPNNWPVNTLKLGNITYTKTQLLNILNKPVRGDKTISLAHQLIAAKLNTHPALYNNTTCIVNEILAADSLLSIYPVGSNYKQSINLITILDNYNNGRLCENHHD